MLFIRERNGLNQWIQLIDINWELSDQEKIAEVRNHFLPPYTINWFGLVRFYGISNLVGYLMSNFTQVTPNELVCDVNWWVSCRVSALYSVVAGSISSRGDYGINCCWDLIRSKQLFSVSVCHAQVFAEFSGRDTSIYNIIPLLKKKVYLFIHAY